MMQRSLAIAAGLALAAVLVVGCDAALDTSDFAPTAASSHGTVEVVTEADIVRQPENTTPTNNWVLYTRTSASVGTFITGPETPPSGVGSLEFVTPTGADKVYLFNYDHIGTALSAIDGMGYSTYRTAGSAQQVTSINLQIDRNGPGPGGFSTLVFEPVYNTSQGPVTDGVWQSWDAYSNGAARWWGTSGLTTAALCGQFTCTWAQILAEYPDATILGAFGLNQGSGNPALTAAGDLLSIHYTGGGATYDFEPYRVATDKNACKKGGWQDLRRADGTPFRNQGACVSYTNTGR